jgi:transcription antitermination factor NusG
MRTELRESGCDSIGGAMSTAHVGWPVAADTSGIESPLQEPRWYAIQTRCRFEKKADQQLQNKGIESFLPLVKQVHRWSDRRQVVESPLFPGYGFVRLSDSPACRLRVLQTIGVSGFVMANGIPIPIPEQQLEDVRLLLAHDISFKAYPFLKAGQRVRIRGGCLEGLEGILVSENRDHSLVISLNCIQRSLAIRIEGYDVEPV